MTCHNRRKTTLNCDHELSVFLVDDGSTDGTTDAVIAEFPDVTIIAGNGRLYWGGGMQLAFNAAAHHDLDLHLWLNDDVELDRDAISQLLTTYEQVRRQTAGPVIVAGAVLDPVDRSTTYSGLRQNAAKQ
jgi:GT2 family glycosyltransferase